MLIRLLTAGINLSIIGASMAHSAALQVPLVERVECAVLDRLLGPVEDTDSAPLTL